MLTGWIDQDRKLACLKALQGMIWDEGYRQRAFVPELYGDVLPALTQWRARGIRLGIYSSGSEQAQRLLFAHTNAGDVTSLFEHFFDTSVGEKQTASRYRTISEQIGPKFFGVYWIVVLALVAYLIVLAILDGLSTASHTRAALARLRAQRRQLERNAAELRERPLDE